MKLFRRFVSLSIVYNNKQIIINDEENNRDDDLKISFEVVKSNFSTPNSAVIEVYNLNKQTRDALSASNMYISLSAGYEDNYTLMFKGDSTNIFHKLDGLNWISTFVCSENFLNIKNSYSNKAFKKDAKIKEVLKDLAKDLDIEFDSTNIKDIALKAKELVSGKSYEKILELCNTYDLQAHIQNNKLKINTNKLNKKTAINISSKNGLLKEKGVVKTELGVNLRVMLISSLIPGDTIYLDASYINEIKQSTLLFAKQDITLESLNGYYNIAKVTFKGDNYDGEYTTSLECLNGI